jgi:predicted HAD superfamily phosphohydrolase YqeG
VRAPFTRAAGLDDVVRQAAKLPARTMIFDVEPLVAYWDGGQDALDQGIARVLSEVAVLPALEVVCFATNSVRRPSAVPRPSGVRVVYLASAGKPLRTAPYLGFHRPGMVIGDQVATDGILARRLGYAFVMVDPQLTEVPTGPRLMAASGRLVRPLLFRRAEPVSPPR